MDGKKLRIAWFTHLVRSNEAVASVSQYCTDLLLPLMRDSFEIEVFSGLPRGTHLGVPRYHTLNAYQRHRTAPFDIFFYQIENGPLGRVVRTQAGMMPGISWMHDTLLTDPGAEALHTSPWQRSVRQMLDGSIPFLQGSEYRLPPPRQASRETSVSPLVLYTSPWAEGTFSRYKSGRYEYASSGHWTDWLPPPVELVEDARSPDKSRPFEIVAIGTTLLEGRAHKFLPALADFSGSAHLTWVVDAAKRDQASLLIEEFGVSDRVTLLDQITPEDWRTLVAKSDLALHLSTNSHYRLSPYLEISRAACVPTVVMRVGREESTSEDVAFVIVPGLHETAQLVGIFEAVSRTDSRRLGIAGQALVKRENDSARVAERLGDVFRVSAPLLRDVMRAWNGLYQRAEGALLEDVRGLVDAPTGDMPGAYETIVRPFVEELRLMMANHDNVINVTR
jgi:hypothetical protein